MNELCAINMRSGETLALTKSANLRQILRHMNGTYKHKSSTALRSGGTIRRNEQAGRTQSLDLSWII